MPRAMEAGSVQMLLPDSMLVRMRLDQIHLDELHRGTAAQYVWPSARLATSCSMTFNVCDLM